MASCTLPLQEALNDSISSGLFADTKIILYSRRDGASGTIIKPKTLYANGHVLKSVPYFGNQKLAESEPKDFSEPIDEDEQAKKYGYCSDSDLEDEEDAVDVGRAVPPYGESNESSGKGAVIKIHDIALITFQAFLMYLYTGHIEFAPYGSKENRRSRSKEIVSLSEDSIPRPSPKSIYRLADKYDIPPLKRLALDNIRDGLERCDIVEEVFNKYSSSHEEVRTIYATHLASVLSRAEEKSVQGLWVKVDEKIGRYINGNLDHAVDATTLLWKLSKGNVNCPPVTPAAEAP
ncbi:hypothetical protein BJ322DRAFT_827295 [Thelephora terrestris]|uniref:BTB domain-containing protein n=1 Tax=Thelephora terrestris TaxID=56493 RepID=A0A9P6L6F8_9AGAM|nr:hypothetical protein BJ322DRAFT_827295 [Thelephora terrestris]